MRDSSIIQTAVGFALATAAAAAAWNLARRAAAANAAAAAAAAAVHLQQLKASDSKHASFVGVKRAAVRACHLHGVPALNACCAA